MKSTFTTFNQKCRFIILILLFVLSSGSVFGQKNYYKAPITIFTWEDINARVSRILRDPEINVPNHISIQPKVYIRLKANSDIVTAPLLATKTTVVVNIIPFLPNGDADINSSVNHTLIVVHNPIKDLPQFIDLSSYEITNRYGAEVRVISCRTENSNTPSSNPSDNVNSNITLELGFESERYYQVTEQLPAIQSTEKYDPADTTRPVALEFSWSSLVGALEYELEWTWVDNYSDTALTNKLQRNEINFSERDFELNNTRIRTPNLNYQIPLIYARGYIIYRVRAVGRFLNDTKQGYYGPWSSGINTKTTLEDWNSIEIATAHENKKNWQFQASYAEQGKKKEVVSYFDGSLRNRQTVTKVNSDNNVVAGEVIYDTQGRAAIEVLPVPLKSEYIRYFKDLNQNINNKAYTHLDFDWEPKNLVTCATTISGMSNSSGASKYYSADNDVVSPFRDYVPSALKLSDPNDPQYFPFSQVEYTPDNTGRIAAKGGVGPDHQVGSGHEMKYLYTVPHQEELNRLFGYEVGYASHYKKNAVVDPNGQISVSYIDPQGRTIATALAGNAKPDGSSEQKLISLDDETDVTWHKSITVDLLNKVNVADSDTALDSNELIATTNFADQKDALLLSKNIGVVGNSDYKFEYTVANDSVFTPEKCPDKYSFVYDLNVSLKDNCASDKFTLPIKNKSVGTKSIGPTPSKIEPSISIAIEQNPLPLSTGNYSLIKELKINKTVLEEYADDYIAKLKDSRNPDCYVDPNDFKPQTVSVDCNTSCSECTNLLGTKENHIKTQLNGYYGEPDTSNVFFVNPTTFAVTISLPADASGINFGQPILQNAVNTLAIQFIDEWDTIKAACAQLCNPAFDTHCTTNEDILLSDVSPNGQYGLINLTDENNPNSMDILSVFNEKNRIIYNGNVNDNDTTNRFSWRGPISDKLDSAGNPIREYFNEEGNPAIIEVEFDGTIYTPAIVPTAILTDVDGKKYVKPQDLLNLEDFLYYWPSTNSWARSLVQFHPEFHYLQYSQALCNEKKEVDILQTGGTKIKQFLNSDAYDSYINSLDTYDKALAAGLFDITSSTSFSNIFTTDPYFTQSGLQTANGLQAVETAALNAQRRNIMIGAIATQYEDHAGLNMFQVAVMTTKCNAIQICNLSTLTSSYNNGEKNAIWETYKTYYTALKGNIKQVFAGIYATSKGGANSCIGKMGSMELTSVIKNYPTQVTAINALIPNPTSTPLCNLTNSGNYKEKEKRFIPNDFGYDSDVNSEDALAELLAQANYQSYLQTGNCPLVNDLEHYLDGLFTDFNSTNIGSLTNTSNWNTIGRKFTAKLFAQFTGEAVPLAANVSAPTTSITIVGQDLEFSYTPTQRTGAGNPLILSMPSGSLNWSNYKTSWQIKKISRLYYDKAASNLNSVSPVFVFKVVAQVQIGSATTNLTEIILTGRTVAQIGECHVSGTPGIGETLNPVTADCDKKEQFSGALKALMIQLQTNGTIGNLDVNITSIITPSYLKIYLGINSGDNVKWSNDNTNVSILVNNVKRIAINLAGFTAGIDSIVDVSISGLSANTFRNILKIKTNNSGLLLASIGSGNPRMPLYFACCSPCGEVDYNGDGYGDQCADPCGTVDSDSDGVFDGCDNCITIPNPYQEDANLDGVGDACEGTCGTVDTDGDNINDGCDPCPNQVGDCGGGTTCGFTGNYLADEKEFIKDLRKIWEDYTLNPSHSFGIKYPKVGGEREVGPLFGIFIDSNKKRMSHFFEELLKKKYPDLNPDFEFTHARFDNTHANVFYITLSDEDNDIAAVFSVDFEDALVRAALNEFPPEIPIIYRKFFTPADSNKLYFCDETTCDETTCDETTCVETTIDLRHVRYDFRVGRYESTYYHSTQSFCDFFSESSSTPSGSRTTSSARLASNSISSNSCAGTCIPQTVEPIACDTPYDDYIRFLAFDTTPKIEGLYREDVETKEDFCQSNLQYLVEDYKLYIDSLGVKSTEDPNYLSIVQFGDTDLHYGYKNMAQVIAQYAAYNNVPEPKRIPIYAANDINKITDISTPSDPRYYWKEYVNSVYVIPDNECPPVAMPYFSPLVPTPSKTPCDELLANVSSTYQNDAYEKYMASLREKFVSNYIKKAMENVVETFTMNYGDKEYQYTLYYYDQAGNLIKTVAPEGVNRLNTQDTAINNSINAMRKGTIPEANSGLPNHSFVTEYRYNSLNQLVYQNTPDGGSTRFAYDRLGRIIASQNAKQEHVNSVNEPRFMSYTLYDDLGRITEAGEGSYYIDTKSTGQTYYITDDGKLRKNISDENLDEFYSDFKSEVTRTIYTENPELEQGVYASSLFTTNTGDEFNSATNNRNRVTGVFYYDTYNHTAPLVFNNALLYNYDIHGNVKEMVTYYSALKDSNCESNQSITSTNKPNDCEAHLKRVVYDYDLISGNVNQVKFQPNKADQFIHKYEYDADNRIANVQTSTDGALWEKDANYLYYPHGPLARVELGDKKVQGIDYAYTLQGWLKTVNGENITAPDNDLGKDGSTNSTTKTKDAFGYSLSYYDNDYRAITNNDQGTDSFKPLQISRNGTGNTDSKNLYNGNIKQMTTALLTTDDKKYLDIQKNNYEYDQLNRIKKMTSTAFDPKSISTTKPSYKSSYSYDRNGNLMTMNNHAISGTGAIVEMDNFSYRYDVETFGKKISNKLTKVIDSATNRFGDGVDIKNNSNELYDAADSNTHNYIYDKIGQLIQDKSEGLAIDWRVDGKVKKVTNSIKNTEITFNYDGLGNRIAKEELQKDNYKIERTIYARDAQGNVLGVYRDTQPGGALQNILYLNNTTISNAQTKKAINTIIVAGNGQPVTVTATGNLQLTAGNQIILRPGFSTTSGATFSASIAETIISNGSSVTRPLALTEHHIYGSSRLGLEEKKLIVHEVKPDGVLTTSAARNASRAGVASQSITPSGGFNCFVENIEIPRDYFSIVFDANSKATWQHPYVNAITPINDDFNLDARFKLDPTISSAPDGDILISTIENKTNEYEKVINQKTYRTPIFVENLENPETTTSINLVNATEPCQFGNNRISRDDDELTATARVKDDAIGEPALYNLSSDGEVQFKTTSTYFSIGISYADKSYNTVQAGITNQNRFRQNTNFSLTLSGTRIGRQPIQLRMKCFNGQVQTGVLDGYAYSNVEGDSVQIKRSGGKIYFCINGTPQTIVDELPANASKKMRVLFFINFKSVSNSSSIQDLTVQNFDKIDKAGIVTEMSNPVAYKYSDSKPDYLPISAVDIETASANQFYQISTTQTPLSDSVIQYSNTEKSFLNTSSASVMAIGKTALWRDGYVEISCPSDLASTSNSIFGLGASATDTKIEYSNQIGVLNSLGLFRFTFGSTNSTGVHFQLDPYSNRQCSGIISGEKLRIERTGNILFYQKITLNGTIIVLGRQMVSNNAPLYLKLRLPSNKKVFDVQVVNYNSSSMKANRAKLVVTKTGSTYKPKVIIEREKLDFSIASSNLITLPYRKETTEYSMNSSGLSYTDITAKAVDFIFNLQENSSTTATDISINGAADRITRLAKSAETNLTPTILNQSSIGNNKFQMCSFGYAFGNTSSNNLNMAKFKFNTASRNTEIAPSLVSINQDFRMFVNPTTVKTAAGFMCTTPNDQDQDGITDLYEVDFDSNGIIVEPLRDTDGDGIFDYLDCDDDGDGILTKFEAPGNGITAARNSNANSSFNSNSIPDYLDKDDDGDGVNTSIEGADPDHDGNPLTVAPSQDTDADTIPDYLDSDDDGDSVFTFFEKPNPNGIGSLDTDKDLKFNYLDVDDDGDGILTSLEFPGTELIAALNTNAVAGIGNSKMIVNTIPNYLDDDDDGDGYKTWEVLEGGLGVANRIDPGPAYIENTDEDNPPVPNYLDFSDIIYNVKEAIIVNNYCNSVGDKRYELSNHLGNVLSVISDRKLPDSDNPTTFVPDVLSYSDYYPFGSLVPGRHGSSSDYRYGFNGMEMDDELKGEGNSYTTEFRQYDPRIGRWLSPDPLQKQLPWQSPYVAMDNKPIIRNDVNGDCPTCVSGFIISGLMDMAFQVGEHMFQGDDIGAAFKKVDYLAVLGNASLGAVTGAFDGGISKFAGALADSKKRKILTKVIEFGMETILEQAVKAGYNVTGVEKQIYGLLGYKQLSSSAIGEIGEKNAKDLINEKYKGDKIKIIEQVQGKFDDGKRTIFDFVVLNEDGDIIEVVESKANGAKLTANQKKFYEEGSSVTLFGKRAEAAGLMEKSVAERTIDNKKVKSTLVKSIVNKFTGKSTIEGVASFFKKIFKKK